MLETKTHTLLRQALTFGALLSLIYFCFAYYSIGDRPWLFYNSDNLLPTLYQHIMIKGQKIAHWQFASVSNIFPDIGLFFLMGVFIHNVTTLFVMYGVVQILLFYFLIVAVGKQVVKNEKDITLFQLSALSALLLLAAGCFTHKEIMESAFVSWLHFGSTLMCLAALWQVLRMFSMPSKANIAGLFILCLLSAFSNLLFITQFAMPAIASLVVLWLMTGNKNTKNILMLITVIGLATGSAYFFYKHNAFGLIQMKQESSVLKRSHPAEIMAALKQLRIVLGGFAQVNPLMMFAFIVFFVMATQQMIQRFKSHAIKPVDDRIFYTLAFFWLSIVINFVCLLFLDNDLMVEGYFGMRHYQAFMLFSVFVGIPLLMSRYEAFGELANKLYYYLLLTMVICAYLTSQEGSLRKLTHFYPASIACLDQYADQYQFKQGVANYWEARSYQFLSKKQINLEAVTPDLKPYIQLNDKGDYLNKDFTFLIVQNSGTMSPSYGPGYWPEFYITSKTVRQKLGKPIKVLECPAPFADGKEKIYVFKSGQVGIVFNQVA